MVLWVEFVGSISVYLGLFYAEWFCQKTTIFDPLKVCQLMIYLKNNRWLNSSSL